MSRDVSSPFAAAIAGATIAAVAAGVGEAALVAVERHIGLDPGLFFFTLLFYGCAGVAAGLALALAFAALGRVTSWRASGAVAFAASGGIVLAALVTIIGRFRVFRDVFNETFDGAPISPMMFQLASVVAAILLFVLAFVALRLLARTQTLATSPLVIVGGLVLGLVATGFAMRAGAGGPHHKRYRTSEVVVEGPSVILIMVDTLRADHLSSYGYTANTTPAIDGLAADGTRFAHMFSQASWTRPSVATILTSLSPSSHRAVHKSDVLANDVVTLPEVMQASGYRTIGFANNINVAPLFGFQQGFDEYTFLEPEFFFGATEAAAQLTMYNQLRLIRERYVAGAKRVQNYYQPADVVTSRGLDWIERNGDKPFFMFLHYMDPHDPYFIHPFNGQAYARVENPNPDASMADKLRSAYDGEITYLDGELARLFDALKARGLYDKAAIVLTADHGEEFHEHGGWWHGTTLYDEQIGVPLIVKPPRGGKTGQVSEAIVSSVDIAPTILGVAGVPAPDTMVGKALALDTGAPGPRDHAFSESELEGNILQAYRGEEWKLIQANPGNPRGLPPRQLFEIARDPKELNDVAASRQDEVATLAAQMNAVRSHAEAVAVRGSETAIDGATEERLRALGYVH